MRSFRIPIGLLQQLFISALILPLKTVGLILLLYDRQFDSIVLLLAIPAYYLNVQSLLHTERRYVYVIHFFFFILASAAIWWIVELVSSSVRVAGRKA